MNDFWTGLLSYLGPAAIVFAVILGALLTLLSVSANIRLVWREAEIWANAIAAPFRRRRESRTDADLSALQTGLVASDETPKKEAH